MMTFFKNKLAKLILTTLFGIAVFSCYLYLAVNGTGTYPALYYACIVLSTILSLLYAGSLRQILLTCALFCACVADYFLILNYSVTHQPHDQIYGMFAFCALQIFFAIYTYLLHQSVQIKITMFGVRIIITLLLTIIMPLLNLGLLEILSAVYIVNFLITIIILISKFQTEWLTLIGMVLFFICDIIVGLTNGGSTLLGITNLQWLSAHDYAFFFYVPGIFIITLSTVWFQRKRA